MTVHRLPLTVARRSLSAVSCLLIIGIVSAPGVLAQDVKAELPAVGEDPAFDAKARAVAEQLRCPVCLGNSIQDSPSELAGDMRDLVREQLAAGKSEAEVKKYFVARYGEWVLLNPTAEGFNLVVWVLPGMLLVGGAVVVWVAVKKWAAAGGRARLEAAESSAADDYIKRVREEVGRGEP